jgi:hypothetical protein
MCEEAVKKLTDQAALAEFAKYDSDWHVRGAAEHRLRKLQSAR